MSVYIIEGGKKLSGTVTISGNKNSVFPLIAAGLLTEEEIVLTNVPQIADVNVSIEILKNLGVETKRFGDTLTIKASEIKTQVLPAELTSKLRGAVVFAGGILARIGKVQFTHPGGDIIGKRSIESHLDGFKSLGYEVKISDLEYRISQGSNNHNQVKIFMEEASVTATENLILASVLGSKTVTLKNCAREPHVLDLCHMLVKMGAKIEGIGNSTLTLTGVKKLSGTTFALGPDYLEFASYAIAAILTGGQVKIEGCDIKDLEPVTYPLIRMGARIEDLGNESVLVSVDRIKPLSKLTVNIWPGFPTDLMSLFIVLATQAHGVSLMHDWMYESRMFFVDKLIGMGAQINIADPHRVLVYGPTKLHGRELETPDIRAGMALVLAGLIAKGQSVINKAELIERGYERVVEKLTSLGAEIKKIE